MKNLGLIFFPAFDWMINPTHPERQERLLYTRDQLIEEGIFDFEEIREYRPQIAKISDLEKVHVGIPQLSNIIKKAHLVSAGSCMTAADAVMKKEVKKAFALVRPPGHHAMRIVHGIRGFCVINNEAIMVSHLREKYGVKKIAIVDTDVHHGDGTQDIFYHDKDVLYISFHQDGRTLYPGSGFLDELGGPGAYGSNLNIPLLPGSGDEEIHKVFDFIINPILKDFSPEIIINSAGQDNHFSDPLSSMNVTAKGYAQFTQKLNADIAVLEGGYSVEDALPYINTGIILAMAGLDYSNVGEPFDYLKTQDKRCMHRVDQLINEVDRIWSNKDDVLKKWHSKNEKTFSREKNIYYDEDGIRDYQLETKYYCKDCLGYITTYSNSSSSRFKNREAFIVTLERNICSKCKEQAYEIAYKEKKMKKYEYVYVQNTLSGHIEKI